MTDDWAKQKARKLDSAYSLDIESALLEASRRGEERMRERAASLAGGEIYHDHYRTWPWWVDSKWGGRGNRSNDSELVKHCDEIAAAIRSLPVGGDE